MVDDPAEGLAKKVSGSINEAIGKITGDTGTQVAGGAEKAVGTEQNADGAVEHGARDRSKG